VIAETVLVGLTPAHAARGSVPYSVDVQELPDRFEYALRIHLDVDEDGQVSAGDWVSAARIAIDARIEVVPRVTLRRVG
jgi:hypothetical protein